MQSFIYMLKRYLIIEVSLAYTFGIHDQTNTKRILRDYNLPQLP
ncbi:MAG: hypothetical protein ACI9KI_001789 [Patiriisocius sp.]|jgi:hypothetical protein